MDTTTIEEPVHTEEVQDIIANPPAWLYRWGISLFFGILLLCVGMSAMISYPEVVKTQLRILSVNQPQPVSLKARSKLLKINVLNGQPVKKGQALALVEQVQGNALVVAQGDAKVAYAGIIHEGQQLTADQPLFYLSAVKSDFYGELFIPPSSVNAVKPGQSVLIKLKDYPHQEYGMLHGTIKYITGNSQANSGVVAEVDFANIKTTTNYSIPLRQGMAADADIISAPATLLHRFTKSMMKGAK